MNIENFIKPELLILVPVLYFIGMGLKKSPISNKFIPIVLGIISVILATAWVVSTSDISSLKDVACAFFVSITQGILAAGTSVYINQIYVQSKKSE